MKTIIYAAYLPGSTKPDYVGSHLAQPLTDSAAQAFKYKYSTYVGAGAWVSRNGCLRLPSSTAARPWGAKLLAMSPQERLAIRVETLETVDTAHRWAAEARAIRSHLPPFNVALKDGPEVKRQKYNAYMRGYLAAYRKNNPDKLEAKRKADRERLANKRAQAKAAVQQAPTIPTDPQPVQPLSNS